MKAAGVFARAFSEIVPSSMLSKAAMIPRVVSERGLLRTPKSKSDFAPGLVNVTAVMMLKSAPYTCLVFGSRLVQKICICTFFKDGGEMNFTIKTAFVNELFLALIPTMRISFYATWPSCRYHIPSSTS